jgi:hypothetical protein
MLEVGSCLQLNSGTWFLKVFLALLFGGEILFSFSSLLELLFVIIRFLVEDGGLEVLSLKVG